MSDPTDAAELEAADAKHQASEGCLLPDSSQEPSGYNAASCTKHPENAMGTLFCIEDSPVGPNMSSLYSNVKFTAAPLTEGSPLQAPEQPHRNSTLPGHSLPPNPSRATIAAAQAPAPANPLPAAQMEDSPAVSAAPGSEVDTEYITLLLEALHSMNRQPPSGAAGQAAAALPTVQSSVTPASSLAPSNMISSTTTNTSPAVAAVLQGSSSMPQSQDATLQQLQLARLLLNRSTCNNGNSSTPGPVFPALTNLSALLPQQLLLINNTLAGAGTGAMTGQVHPAIAAGNLGLGLLPPVDLAVVHAAATAAATAAIANQRAAMDASVQSGHGSLSPTRHAFRSDGSINTLYKTQCCRAWMSTGYCKYEERCQFAHGSADIHGVYRPAKYKTVPCRNIRATGRCPFGKRCNFIHESEDDLSSSPASSTGGASTASTAGSDISGSRRTSSSGGFLPGHAGNNFGDFTGAAGPPNVLASGLLPYQLLASGLQCNQLVMPSSLAGFRPGALDLGSLNLLNTPTGMVPPGSGNIADLIQYATPALALNKLLLDSQGGLSTAILGVPGQATAGMGECPGSNLAEMLCMLQLR